MIVHDMLGVSLQSLSAVATGGLSSTIAPGHECPFSKYVDMNTLFDSATSEESASEARTSVIACYRVLRRGILDGVFPPGEKLRPEFLRHTLGTGTSTLREAVSLLIADGLVIAQPQRGFRVAAMSLEDLKDLTESRVLVETKALRDSIALGGDAWEADVVAALHRLRRVEEALELNKDDAALSSREERNYVFHKALISACGSPRLLNLFEVFYAQAERYRRLSVAFHATQQIATPPRDAQTEHQEIADAVLRRDYDTAGAKLERHIRLTYEFVQHFPASFFKRDDTRR